MHVNQTISELILILPKRILKCFLLWNKWKKNCYNEKKKPFIRKYITSFFSLCCKFWLSGWKGILHHIFKLFRKLFYILLIIHFSFIYLWKIHYFKIYDYNENYLSLISMKLSKSAEFRSFTSIWTRHRVWKFFTTRLKIGTYTLLYNLPSGWSKHNYKTVIGKLNLTGKSS